MRFLRIPAFAFSLATTAALAAPARFREAAVPPRFAAALRSGEASPQARVQTVVGVVTAYAPAQKSFTVQADGGDELRFQWDSRTKFNGVVFKGAKISVRYTTAPGGELVAQTVGVVK